MPSITHFGSFCRTLVADSERESLPACMNKLDTGSGRDVFVVDWELAQSMLFYRRVLAGATAMSEPGHGWGSVAILQLMLAVGVEKLSPHFAKQLDAFAPYLLGPPHSTDRHHWEETRPLPAQYVPRLAMLRRRAHVWLENDPRLLPHLVDQFNETAKLALPPGIILGVATTTFDRKMLATLATDRRRTVELTPMIKTVKTNDREELAAIEHAERLGCMSEFDASAHLHKNYLFVKLSSYVKDVWAAQEETPVLRFANADGGPIPDTVLSDACTGAFRWLSRLLQQAGGNAAAKVFDAAGVDAAPDHVVFYRTRAKRTAEGTSVRKERKPRLYTVNPPPAALAERPVEGVRVRPTRRGLFINPGDIKEDFKDLLERYVAEDKSSAARRREDFTAAVAKVGTTRYVHAAYLTPLLPLGPFRSWMEEEFAFDSDAWIKRWEAREVAAKREAGLPVRKKLDFSPDEDRAISEVATRGYTPKGTWDALASQWPHHSKPRIAARGKLLALLIKRGFEAGKPITSDIVRSTFGKPTLIKYQRAL